MEKILDLFLLSLFVELISCTYNSYTRTLVSMKILTNNGQRESERIYDMYFIYTHPPISRHPFIPHLFPKRCRNEGRTILVTIFFLFVLKENKYLKATTTLFLQEENKPTSERTQIIVNMFLLLLLLEFIFSKLNSKFNSLTLNHLTVYSFL